MVKLKRMGLDKEREVAKQARDKGAIAIRSAASLSPIDVVIIWPEKREIELIQCKATVGMGWKYIDPKLKVKLENEWDWLDGDYSVSFKAL